MLNPWRSAVRVARSARTLASLPGPPAGSQSEVKQNPSAEADLLRDLSAPKGRSSDRLSFGSSARRLRPDAIESAPVRASDIDKFRTETNTYYLHCLTSHSNTLLTLTNYKHEPIMWTSAGLCGFKKAARGGYEAGFRSTTTMLEKMKQKEEDDAALELKLRTEPQRVQKTQLKKQKPSFRPAKIELIIKDFGLGREAVMKALMGVEGDYFRNRITKIVDATPLKFGGVRARAVRRL